MSVGWADAAREVAERWIADGKMVLPPDEMTGEDELAFWDEVESAVNGDGAKAFDPHVGIGTKAFDPNEPRDSHGRWTRKPGHAALAEASDLVDVGGRQVELHPDSDVPEALRHQLRNALADLRAEGYTEHHVYRTEVGSWRVAGGPLPGIGTDIPLGDETDPIDQRSHDEIRAAHADYQDLIELDVPARFTDLGIRLAAPNRHGYSKLTNGDFEDMATAAEIAFKEFPGIAKADRRFDELSPYSSRGDGADLMRRDYAWSIMCTAVMGLWPDTKMFVNDVQPRQIGGTEARAHLVPSSANSYVGTAMHEMGHVAAYATFDPPHLAGAEQEQAYIALFNRHNLHYPELAGLSEYAASSPAEAFAELFSMYYTPGYRDQLDPDLARRAGEMFADVKAQMPT